MSDAVNPSENDVLQMMLRDFKVNLEGLETAVPSFPSHMIKELKASQKVNAWYDLRELRKRVSGVEKAIKAEMDKLDEAVQEEMEELGVEQLATGVCAVTKQVELYPNVSDINALVGWAYENGQAGILQRRVTKGVFDEVFQETGEYPPGINAYNKTKLLVRKR